MPGDKPGVPTGACEQLMDARRRTRPQGPLARSPADSQKCPVAPDLSTKPDPQTSATGPNKIVPDHVARLLSYFPASQSA